ncbi:MAG: hypothetical protein HQ503_07980 [Rhodospirillales bacterium]|nr:hypothetical protein [Rhodospirillales bacterium]
MDSSLDQRVTELLCSKICHDLVSPVGAINNGLELINDVNAGMQDEAITLVGNSSRQVACRLEYFRLAFGGWSSGNSVEFGVLRRLLENYCIENKIDLNWSQKPDDSEDISKPPGKLLLNLALIATECAHRAGRLDIDCFQRTDGCIVGVQISGERFTLHEDTRSGFDPISSADQLSVRNVVAYYCAQMAKDNGMVLKFSDNTPNFIQFEIFEG